MKAVIFTYPPHYVAAAQSARALQKLGVHPVLAIDKADPFILIEGIEIIRTDFERGGNLNGKACVIGILKTLKQVAGNDARILKVDSDTLIKGLSWQEGREEDLCGFWHRGNRKFYGLAYSLKTFAIDAMIEQADHLQWLERHAEDETMYDLANTVHRMEHKKPGTSLCFYPWKSDKPDSHWASYEVICFEPGDKKGPREIAAKMRELS